VLVLDAVHPAAGASGIAAGLVNPLSGRNAKAVWRLDEALEALHAMLDEARTTAFFQQGGVLRPTADAEQANRFQTVAARRPHHASWLSAEAVHERFSWITAPEGALLVRQGGALPVLAFVHALLAAAQRRHAEVRIGTRVTGWGEETHRAYVDLGHEQGTERIFARRVLLAMGYDYHKHPELTALNLHPVKGQTVRVACPGALLRHDLIPLAGQGYVVPDGDTLVVGSSYERGFADLLPSEAQTQAILATAAYMLPLLKNALVLDATAGVRVTVPGTRLPMLGPLPGRSRIWLFTGLSSKGLLLAPLLACSLPTYFEQPDRIPRALQVR